MLLHEDFDKVHKEKRIRSEIGIDIILEIQFLRQRSIGKRIKSHVVDIVVSMYVYICI